MAQPEAKSFANIPKEDGSIERWELTDQWRLIRTDPPIEAAIAEHAADPDAHHALGITGEYEGTFKKIIIENGIITEFELE